MAVLDPRRASGLHQLGSISGQSEASGRKCFGVQYHTQIGTAARTGFIAGTRAVRSVRGTHGRSLPQGRKENCNHLLAVEQEVKARCAEIDALRRQQVERARYEAELARRYMSVDPGNRLVAGSLEAEWNGKLRAHAAAQEDYEQQHRLTEEEVRQQVLSLATDFPRVWNDPELEARERKRMLRLLLEDVTLVKADKITAHVRLR
jgi:hypothetical protein